MSTQPKDYVTDVREHYEELPYPYRDVSREGTQFHGADGMGPDAMAHHAWKGRRDLRDGGRILIAGDGTGDASVMWAESLVGGNAEIVAVDLSSRSIALAKERLAKRQLATVTHHHMSILDLPASGLGEFDIIECSGVLHHLEDPKAGLSALAAMLKQDGIMNIMVYAQYGRHAIYMVQDMLRRLMKPGMTRSEKLGLARAFLDHVPGTHWLTVKNELFLEDINWPDGSGIYDLLLHTVDRAYTVPQLYEWVAGAGLHLAWLYGDHTNDSLYRPDHYTNRPEILSALEGKSDAEIFAIGELMHGSIAKHNFYATKEPKSLPQLTDDMIIVYGLMQGFFSGYVAELVNALGKIDVGQRIQVQVKPIPSAPPLVVTKRPSTALLAQAIDGRRSIKDIVARVASAGNFAAEAVRDDLQLLYGEMRARNMVFLHHPSVPLYPTVMDMTMRAKSIGLI